MLLALEMPSMEPQACNCLIPSGLWQHIWNSIYGPDTFHILYPWLWYLRYLCRTLCIRDCPCPLKIEGCFVHQTKYCVGLPKGKSSSSTASSTPVPPILLVLLWTLLLPFLMGGMSASFASFPFYAQSSVTSSRILFILPICMQDLYD